MRRSVPHPAPESTPEDTFTPTRVWPWVLALVLLGALLVSAAWVHSVGPGATSPATVRPTPVPTPGSFSQKVPVVEPVPRPGSLPGTLGA